jgi:hypothetical protein
VLQSDAQSVASRLRKRVVGATNSPTDKEGPGSARRLSAGGDVNSPTSRRGSQVVDAGSMDFSDNKIRYVVFTRRQSGHS